MILILTFRQKCDIIYGRRRKRALKTAALKSTHYCARASTFSKNNQYAGIFRHSAKILAKASMRNTNFKKYAGLFRRPPNVANRIRLRRVTSNAPVFNKISYAGLSKWSQRGGLENRLPNRHGGSNPSACAIKTNTIPRGWCLFLYHSQRGRTLVREAKRGVRIPQAHSKPRGTKHSRYLRREEM